MFNDHASEDYKLLDSAPNGRSPVHVSFNNRMIHLYEFATPAALYLQRHGYVPSGGDPGRSLQQIIDVSKQAVRDVIHVSVFPFGAFGDFNRGYQGGRAAHGYGSSQAASITWIAEHLARAGDTDLYDYRTTAGAGASAGAPDTGEGAKDIRYANRTVMRYNDGTYRHYWNGDPIHAGEGGAMGDPGDHAYWAHSLFHAARYYQDQDLAQASTAQRPGMTGYPSNPPGHHGQPGYTHHGGVASTLFMFAYPNTPISQWPNVYPTP